MAGFAAALAGGLVIGLVAAAFGAGLEDPPPAVIIISTIVQDVALVGAAILFARSVRTPYPAQFGLRSTRTWPAIGWMALGWLAFTIFSATWAALLDISETDDLPSDLGADKSTAALVAVAVLVTVVAPIAEEVFFRGYFFAAVRNWRGPGPAAVITGLVFGLIHAGSAPVAFLVPLAFLGFVLCLIYQRTGSLYPCITLHALNNSLALGVTQGWGWQIPLTMAGSLAVIAAIVLPVGSSQPRLA